MLKQVQINIMIAQGGVRLIVIRELYDLDRNALFFNLFSNCLQDAIIRTNDPDLHRRLLLTTGRTAATFTAPNQD